jgi:NIPSNAP
MRKSRNRTQRHCALFAHLAQQLPALSYLQFNRLPECKSSISAAPCTLFLNARPPRAQQYHTNRGAALCRMFTPETGGGLNKVYHFYAYHDMAEREAVRQAMVDRDKWLRFLDKSRPHVKGPQARWSPWV